MSWYRTHRTESLGGLALATAGILAVVEMRHIRRRGSAPLAAVREGLHAGSTRENAVFNMLLSFAATFGAARAITLLIRTGRGPFGNLVIGRRHIHHFVPGIAVALAAGGVSIGVRREGLDTWLAVPFGAGAALVFDEAALLLALEDVYWSPEGILSVQISLATAALLGALGLLARLVHRGDRHALPAAPAPR